MALAALAQLPPGGASTRQSPACQTTWIRVLASTVAPLAVGPAVTTATVAAAGDQDKNR